MAFGGVPINHSEMTDLSEPETSGVTSSAHDVAGAALAHDLVHQLGQFSLDSSPVITPKVSKKFFLKDLEIQQTIGRLLFRL